MRVFPGRLIPPRTAAPLLMCLGLVAALLPPLPSIAQETPVTAGEAVRMAVENNLDLKVQTFNPAIATTGIQGSRGIYDTAATALFSYLGQDRQTVPNSNSTQRSH